MSYPYITDVINDLLGTNIHLPIATFGTFVAIAILIAAWIMRLEVERKKSMTGALHLNGHTPNNLVTDLAFITTISGVVGAKLFDIAEQPQMLMSEPLELIFSTGGFSIYGGLILGTLAGILYLRKKSVSILPMLDAAAPALSIGYAIGRLGCQFSGDGDWGKPAVMNAKPEFLPNWLWAQTYSNNVLQVEIPSPGVYPTPIYEAAGALLIFLVLWLLKDKLKVTGYLFCIYLIASALARWLVENIRINQLYDVLGIMMSQAQIISLGLMLIGIGGFFYLTTQSSRQKAPASTEKFS